VTSISRRLQIGTALIAVYVIWGSTYLALRFGLKGFTPFILNGIRFTVAGGLLFTFLRIRGTAPPTRRQWWNLARIAALMLVGGVGLVTVAEDAGVGSGVAATAIAVMPLWAALWSGLFGRWPSRLEWIGLFVGFGGVLILAQEGDFRATAGGMALVMIAPMLWAFGSVWSRRLDLPSVWMATAAQLLAAGAILLVLGPLRGERIATAPPAEAWLALLYLTVMGSLLAFTAYVYLLREVSAPVATSYAYVNPVIAVVLGLTLGGEVVSGPAFVALPLILSGVGIVGLAQRRTHTFAAAESSQSTRPMTRPMPAKKAA
jgi:drug/metabolite transporter (DMT)-like permease